VGLSYAIITPARNEADTLPRLARALRAQTRPPTQWIIVENGSTDRTMDVANAIGVDCDWARLLVLPTSGPRERGAPIVQALHAGLASLEGPCDVVVNVDADVTVEPDYFERLLAEFAGNPSLGIAGGSAWELFDGAWRQRFVTGGTVWGATRAYRWKCLQDVLPLEERHGWDGIDQLKARSRGWETKTFLDLPFKHHRTEGSQDGSTWAHWRANGDTAHFMGYRTWYIAARALHHARRDIAAFGLLYGYVSAAVRRCARLSDAEARAVLREDQRFRNILRRRREARGFPLKHDGRDGGT
jgi:poly-beta-1,6-N-acetyl-D-glucosamine synthase